MIKLVKYEAALHALVEAVEIDEVKDIKDKARAMAVYAEQAKDTKLIKIATEINVRAQRKLGQMLTEMEKNKGAATNAVPQGNRVATLDSMDISKKQSVQYQQMALISSNDFEDSIEEQKEKSGKITTAGILRKIPKTVDEQTPDPKKASKPKPDIKPKIDDGAPEGYDKKDQEIDSLKASIHELKKQNDTLLNTAYVNDLDEIDKDEVRTRLDNLTEENRLLTLRVQVAERELNTQITTNSQMEKQIKKDEYRHKMEMKKVRKECEANL